ncbi:MAG: hypothetical protein Q8943_13830, partial [Bacteroidota bacterium]|nr:hypothetical protein [Bacteroidota bacterium]
MVTHEFTMDEKLAFLRQPGAYPGKTDRVQVIETHMSWVFLTAAFAYKLKKPVKYRLLDLRILDARFRNCREEVLLNKRLAPDIYLGIIPLVADDRNTLSLEGKGQIVDWLVRMKRIAAGQLLDQAIKYKTVRDAQLKKAALLLATFYKTQPAIPQGTGLYRSRLRADIQAIHRQLIQPRYHLPLQEVNQYTTSLQSFLTANAGLFEDRAIKGHIRELHGDLRPEHICIGPHPAIIDCLEFSRMLRIQDTADELAFLFMECELLGNDSVEKIFLSTY